VAQDQPVPATVRAACGDRRGQFVPGEVSYGDTWRVLARLARLGEVEKITVAEMRPCYWRRWLPAQPAADLPDLEAGQ
jgi:hypothetical protein